MISILKKTACTAMALAAMAMLTALAARAETPGFSPAQQKAIGAIVKEYLLDNPGVIFEAVEAHRLAQERQARQQAQAKIGEHLAYLTRADAPAIGNPDADITVIEFFDYNCGYCKQALPDIQAAVRDDGNLRVVFKEMPILGPASRTAAAWALAAHRQGKYFEYHVALMAHKGPKNAGQLARLAKDTGLDVKRMKKDIAGGEIEKELGRVMEIAREIGVSGTPAFIVGRTFIPGYTGEEGLKQAIAEERRKMPDKG